MTTSITEDRKQCLVGPDRLTLELDADQIYPEDPGQGTPVLVRLHYGETATFNCAVSEREVEGVPLTDKQCEWLNEMADAIDLWLTARSKEAMRQ